MRHWPIELLIAGAVVLAMNVTFIYLAVNNSDPVVESYETEAR